MTEQRTIPFQYGGDIGMGAAQQLSVLVDTVLSTGWSIRILVPVKYDNSGTYGSMTLVQAILIVEREKP